MDSRDSSSTPRLVLLSAKTGERLHACIRKHLDFLRRENQGKAISLCDYAYTLQVGRIAQECRIAFLAESVSEVERRFSQLLGEAEPDGEARFFSSANLNRGSVHFSRIASGADAALPADETTVRLIEAARRWCRGERVDWRKTCTHQNARRISLPTYPFAETSYWLDHASEFESGGAEGATLHPLIHRNESDAYENVFASEFGGEEFFLADHQVEGRGVLPAVAQLEMARFACAKSLRVTGALSVQEVVWLRPLVVEGGEGTSASLEVYTRVLPLDESSAKFELYRKDADGAEVVCSQGRMSALKGLRPKLDVQSLIARSEPLPTAMEVIYQAYADSGIRYGAGHRGLKVMRVAREGTAPMVLAQVQMPASVSHTASAYVIHPSIVDSALQAAIAMSANVLKDLRQMPLLLPFAVDAVHVHGQCPTEAWVWVRHSADHSAGSVEKLDVSVCDAAGEVCVELIGFSSRNVDRSHSPPTIETLYYLPKWLESPRAESNARTAFGQHHVLVIAERDTASMVPDANTQIHRVCLSGDLAVDYETAALELLEILSSVIRAKEPVLVQVLVSASSTNAGCFFGLSGLLRTARLENPQLVGQCMQMAASDSSEMVAQRLLADAGQLQDEVIRYVEGARQVRALTADAPPPSSRHCWQDGGVYLITGGAGGLGLIFAQQFAANVNNVRVILTGRSKLSAERLEQIEGLTNGTSGTRFEYRQLDVSDARAVKACVDEILREHGTLTGIVHGAGVLADNFILKKTPDELRRVLAPKVAGLIHLDEATRELKLREFICFSSVSALGTAGQADYAAANAFMDEYMAHRQQRVKLGERHGASVSIGWPLWAEGGMRVDESVLAQMRRAGFEPLATQTGLEALAACMQFATSPLNAEHVLVMSGKRALIARELARMAQSASPRDAATQNTGEDASVDQGLLRDKTLQYLKRMLSKTLKLPADRIESEASFEKYGIDSILALRIVEELERAFGTLPKTLMFEYQSIAALCGYFLAHHGTALRERFKVNAPIAAQAPLAQPATISPSLITAASAASVSGPISRLRTLNRESLQRSKSAVESPDTNEPIAIIGLSGRYPQADSVAEYWENLKNGKDCITEIPASRWDHSRYFDAQKGRYGKTYSKWGGFISGVDEFDALFFNVSPGEAVLLDPQERLFLQCVYQALEDAGYTRESLAAQGGPSGNVGVFVGVMYQEYQLYGSEALLAGEPYALGGNPSSIANRVSYFCNFHGPSLAVDTMCSSSLTAIHLACQSIRSGGCRIAIAGGTNVSVHPGKYLMLAQGLFSSSTGRCESFGRGGDGYVPGEGVGAVILKPLRQAQADGDRIYGLIRGTGINHGGKTHGFSVPNVTAQAQVIAQALKESQVDARTISYVEAHGTGTSLGDPIEIAGLAQAFAEYTQEKQYCAIGSAKSNIGHLESAAGIAGVTKVLLQMKHGQLVPSLHSQTLNPHIDFATTPFTVQQDLCEWERPRIERNGVTTEYPRIAGISSFGAGGSNAHLILEEYREETVSPTIPITTERAALIVLSAKNEDRLLEQVRLLIEHLSRAGQADRAGPEVDLASIAYTLQVGREAMEHRLAFTASSLDELEAKLAACADSNLVTTEIEECYRGEARKSKDGLAVFGDDEDASVLFRTWFEKGKFTKLLELWVEGLAIDWQRLYENGKPRRVSLPVYPFAKERHWIELPKTVAVTDARAPGMVPALHPLLQRNTSSILEQRFSTILVADVPLVRDHQVRGAHVLPGVCQLEMARAAVLASLEPEAGNSTLELEDVVWRQPLIVNDRREVHIGLNVQQAGKIEFEIYAEEPDAQTVYAHGRAVLCDAREAPSAQDLEALRASCDRPMSAKECYAAFAAAGMEYGPAYQGLQQLHAGVSARGEHTVLARVQMPACVNDEAESYVLHPSVLDAALQASIGLSLLEDGSVATTRLPFALERLQIQGRVPNDAWVVVRVNAANTGGVQKLDIDICDESGRLCVRMTGLSLRVLANRGARTLLLRPQWRAEAFAPPAASGEARGEHWVCLGRGHTEHLEQLKFRMPEVKWLALTQWGSMAEDLGSAAEAIFERIRTQLNSRPVPEILLQVVLAGDVDIALRALSGLLKSAAQEHPKFLGQVIEVPPNASAAQLADAIAQNAHANYRAEQQIRYVQGVREVFGFTDCESAETVDAMPGAMPWKDRGVYLITGGAGGLGLIVAREIAARVRDARVILTGRSELSAERRERIESLTKASAGTRFEYRQLDVSDASAVNTCVAQILQDFGSLHGIVHSAGVVADNFIIRKTAQELRAVLAPKIAGLINLDVATREVDLDFMLLFSSLTGAVGNVGQCDYATANAFLDAYAGYREEQVTAGERKGRTLSIGWPLWEEGGMQVDETTRATMRSQGLEVLGTAEGLAALYQAWRSGESHVVIATGDEQKLRRMLALPSALPSSITTPRLESASAIAQASPPLEASDEPLTGGDLRDKARRYLKKLLSKTLKLSAERIESDVAFESYGIDSVSALQMVTELETAFGALPKTLMFEYQSIEALGEYFLEQHGEALKIRLNVNSVASAPAVTATPASAASVPQRRKLSRGGRFAAASAGTPAADAITEPIAIIGLSGRYPQADSIAEYWENLKGGKDCITEIPVSRWDHSRYFDAQKGRYGKTYSKWGGFISGVDEFDALFFNIAPGEAVLLDPQERLFLQCVYQTIEDAGYTRESLAEGIAGNVGVFVGVMYQEYQLYGSEALSAGEPYALGGNPSSIANRVSYFCNFHGPSLAVDTMCSSSLTAIHLACQSIRSGGCRIAIAGGTNVSVHPSKYLMLAQGQFSSSTGRCESFGQGGDGYVPGEGVGAVVLKPLSQAEADGDQIYGLIRGSSINHGGKTNGYTVPSVKAQAQVIVQALRQSQVDARTISYVEAHGTGTSLGDPIEIAGLAQAFGEHTKETQYCAIGSAKSNIGHLESAAGIAGVTKVLLQMMHGKLVPSLHSRTLNPHIDFVNTPFTVQQHLSEWQRPRVERDGVMREFPRIAGVSSFGAGGSNAHVILEEYRTEAVSQAIPVTADRPALIVLSAKNDDRLREQVRKLLEHVSKAVEANESVDLASLAYTLQVGREAMEHRLAFTAGSVEELVRKLDSYLASGTEEIHQGEVRRNKEALASFNEDEDTTRLLGFWVQKGKYQKLLELWVKGLSLDWRQLYGEARPRRARLPNYPFSRTRYWPAIAARHNDGGARSKPLHPLIYRNESDAFENVFVSEFDGEEFFLSDHQVQGRAVLPAVAQLEMARFACATSLRVKGALRVQDVVWLRPLMIDVVDGKRASLEVYTRVLPLDESSARFELYRKDADGEAVVCSQGGLSALEVPRPKVDVQGLMAQSEPLAIAMEDIYQAFDDSGIRYGAAHRGLKALRVSRAGAAPMVLAQVQLPASVRDTASGFVLHPSVVDSALQAAVGMSARGLQDLREMPLSLPFAVDAVHVHGECPAEVWVWVRRSADHAAGAVEKLDVSLCNANGDVCVELIGFSAHNKDRAQASRATETLYYLPKWQVSPRTEANTRPAFAQHHVLLIAESEAVTLTAGSNALVHSVRLTGDLALDYQAAALEVFRIMRSVINAREPVLVQVLVSSTAPNAGCFLGLSGLLKTARQENPRLYGQCVLVAASESGEAIAQKLHADAGQLQDEVIRYAEGTREVRALSAETSAPSSGHCWQDGGVYLITGGAGGLGLIVARHMAAKVADAHVILTGRSKLDDERRHQIEALSNESAGTRFEYLELDVSDAPAVQACVAHIVEKYGSLTGIVHSAGVLSDNFILKKTTDEFRRVFAPKVAGLINLDEATRDMKVGQFICFSSVSALGSAGQADYAAANAFMDEYMAHRQQRVKLGQRHGASVSIGWPLWAEGGMQVDESVLAQMRGAGLEPLTTQAGLEALEASVQFAAGPANARHVLVISGKRTLIARELARMAQAASIDDAVSQAQASVNHFEQSEALALQDAIGRRLMQEAAAILKIDASELDLDTELSDYGFESVSLTELSNRISAAYSMSLTPAVFFEHPTLGGLARHISESGEAAVSKPMSSHASVAAAPTTSTAVAPSLKRAVAASPSAPLSVPESNAEPVAIIGASCAFPGAANLEQFWQVLDEGRDCIGEIPSSRWDWRAWYGDPKREANKTNIQWGGFLEDIAQFDPLFFGISPREALVMDPNQRLLLTHVWQARGIL